ncbi:hypothetical protein UFOVP806_28 [uncultured Caudovirales phage]|uniref:Uncharacterized protein n=1 Tax=uncultured Caudovirales phage TaxID=2100421 RepID=A0A6J5P309_9CAUD|nr:hypothetical protein UFOVP806_28 [uncultured Caudovirales phage]
MSHAPFIIFAISMVAFVLWCFFGGGDPPDQFDPCHM